MKKYLFLDDIRNPEDVKWVQFPIDVEWKVARSFNDAVEYVKENGFPDYCAFDHDLGYCNQTINENGIIVVTGAIEEKSGYDFAKWLIEYDMDSNHFYSKL